MMTFTIEFDDRSLTQALAKMNQVNIKQRLAVSGAVEDTLRATASGARSRAPVKLGALKASYRWRMESLFVGEAGTNNGYARHVEFGTGPHEIVPRRRNVLRFVTRDGAVVFARRVSHPGTRPQPHLGPSAEEQRALFPRRITDAVRGASK